MPAAVPHPAHLLGALNDRMVDECETDALAQVLAQNKVLEDLTQARARFGVVAP